MKPVGYDDISDDPSYPLAALCLVGGIAASAITKSPHAAIRGSVIGSLYLYTGYRISNRLSYGHELGTATSVLLSAASLPRALKTQKGLPMTLTVVGVLNTAYYGRKWYDFNMASY